MLQLHPPCTTSNARTHTHTCATSYLSRIKRLVGEDVTRGERLHLEFWVKKEKQSNLSFLVNEVKYNSNFVLPNQNREQKVERLCMRRFGSFEKGSKQ